MPLNGCKSSLLVLSFVDRLWVLACRSQGTPSTASPRSVLSTAVLTQRAHAATATGAGSKISVLTSTFQALGLQNGGNKPTTVVGCAQVSSIILLACSVQPQHLLIPSATPKRSSQMFVYCVAVAWWGACPCQQWDSHLVNSPPYDVCDCAEWENCRDKK